VTTTSLIVIEPKVLASFSSNNTYMGFFKLNDFSIATNYSKIQQIQFCPPRRQW
jgi:hypothetical protein